MKVTGEAAGDPAGGFVAGETVVTHNAPVVLSTGLRGPGSVRFVEINVE